MSAVVPGIVDLTPEQREPVLEESLAMLCEDCRGITYARRGRCGRCGSASISPVAKRESE